MSCDLHQDRDDPHSIDKMVQGIALEANFAGQVEQLRPITQVASMDGFVFSVDPLFQLEAGIRWFLQVIIDFIHSISIGHRRDISITVGFYFP